MWAWIEKQITYTVIPKWSNERIGRSDRRSCSEAGAACARSDPGSHDSVPVEQYLAEQCEGTAGNPNHGDW